MDYESFEFGFWHPFGPHAQEAPERIIERKRREIAGNGWTLWSFQHRAPGCLDAWARLLSNARSAPPLVFCSLSPGAVDPAHMDTPRKDLLAQRFRFAGDDSWLPLPAMVSVPHPFHGRRSEASAFVVERIIHPVVFFEPPEVEWFSQGTWRSDRVPTRGEYLLRPGGSVPLRPVRAILVLREPFLAVVGAEAV
jgi:hypothetical protein